jgi:hypothetical protein
MNPNFISLPSAASCRGLVGSPHNQVRERCVHTVQSHRLARRFMPCCNPAATTSSLIATLVVSCPALDLPPYHLLWRTHTHHPRSLQPPLQRKWRGPRTRPPRQLHAPAGKCASPARTSCCLTISGVLRRGCRRPGMGMWPRPRRARSHRQQPHPGLALSPPALMMQARRKRSAAPSLAAGGAAAGGALRRRSPSLRALRRARPAEEYRMPAQVR